MNNSNINKYRGILKGTAIFGSVQIFQILIAVLRGKIIAIFLGSQGMGLSGLYTTSLAMIITLSSLGINLSSVRYISQIKNDTDKIFLHKQISNTQRVFFIVAFLGCVITLASSKILSTLSFQSSDHVKSYLILSLYVFFSLYNDGNRAILQGMEKLKEIALSSVVPSLFGLIISFPLYRFYHINGIVPCLVIMPLISSICSSFYVFKEQKGYSCRLKLSELLNLSSQYIQLGIVMVLASLLGNLSAYIINSFIVHFGNINDVGLYQAGTSITNQYVGLIFTAMAIDYFPKLSAIVNDTTSMNDTVNKQGEITTLLATPLLAIMIVSSPLLIKILLTNEFQVLNSFIQIIALGMIFKAISFSLGYISFAKGDKRTFFLLEGVYGNVLNVLLSIGGYFFGGLKGLAISYLVNYVLYLICIFIVVRRLYDFKLNKKFGNIILFCIFQMCCVYILYQFKNFISVFSYAFVLLTCLFCFRQINQRINIIEIFRTRFSKRPTL